MADKNTSRRDFLTQSAKAAAMAGLVSGVSCTAMRNQYSIAAGPTPPKIGPDQKIRIGLVGTGHRMKNLVGSLLKRKDVTFVALADIQQKNLDATAKRIADNSGDTPEQYLGDDVYKTKLLARDDIDAVFLATPCYLHGPMYLDCFAAGKHFYGEKPLCIEVWEANALVEAQKKNPGVIGQIGFQRRASKRYEVGIQKMQDGLIGKVYRGVAAWNGGGRGPIGFPREGARVWLGRVKYSGDWMLEQACHTWDVLSWATGKLPVAVSGVGNRGLYKHLDKDRDVTDYYLANIEYDSGLVVDYSHCWTRLYHDERRLCGVYERFVGLDGAIALDEGLIFPSKREQKVTNLKLPGTSNDASVFSFLDALRKGCKPVSTVETARMATLTGLLVRKAVYENRRVEMKELLG